VKNGGKSQRGAIFYEGSMRYILVATTISRKFEVSLNYFILKKRQVYIHFLCFVSNIFYFLFFHLNFFLE